MRLCILGLTCSLAACLQKTEEEPSTQEQELTQSVEAEEQKVVALESKEENISSEKSTEKISYDKKLSKKQRQILEFEGKLSSINDN